MLRVEQIAIHNGLSEGRAEFYLSCAQISVSGGTGSGRPSDLVSFPGAYDSKDPGILINIWQVDQPPDYKYKEYQHPGPAVFTC